MGVPPDRQLKSSVLSGDGSVSLHSSTRRVAKPRLHARRSSLLYYVSAGATYCFTICYLLFGLVGIWAAYDGKAALPLYVSMLMGAAPILLLPLLVPRGDPERAAQLLSVLAVVALTGVIILFALHRVGDSLLVLPLSLSSNLVGSLVAILLPPVLAVALLGRKQRRTGAVIMASVVGLLGVAVLILSRSRGALIGLAVGLALAAYLLLRSRQRRGSLLFRRLDIALIVAVTAFFVLYISAIVLPGLGAGFGTALFGDSARSRLSLWWDVLPLVRDYWYTGSGLGVTPMVLSTYAFLVHVPFLFHAHNLYLQVALEQGAFGLVAFVGIMIGSLVSALSIWRYTNANVQIALAGWMASIVVILVHGLFDAELYAGQLRIVLLLPAAALCCLSWLVAERSGAPLPSLWRRWLLGPMVAVAFMLIPLAAGGGFAHWLADYGAVLQTKYHVAEYAAGGWMIQDSILRVESPELEEAEKYFERALALDPQNATANRRLGQIAVSRDEYDAAFAYIQTAQQAGIDARMTLQYLGELHALRDEPEVAATLWSRLDNRQGQLEARSWWYRYELDDADLLAKFYRAAEIEVPNQ